MTTLSSVPTFRRTDHCRACGGDGLDPVLELKPMPAASGPSDRPPGDGEQTDLFPLTLALCDSCGLVQLLYVVPPATREWRCTYRRGGSLPVVQHYEALARAVSRDWVPPSGVVVDLGSNDGTLLRAIGGLAGPELVGVEPDRSMRPWAASEGYELHVAAFDEDIVHDVLQHHGPADVVVASDLVHRVEDLTGTLWGILELLATDGVGVIEVPDLAPLVAGARFPLVHHDNLSYFSVSTLLPALDRAGLRCLDVEEVDLHGGSLRFTVCGPNSRREPSALAAERLDKVLAVERSMRLAEAECFDQLELRLEDLTDVVGPLFRDLAGEQGLLGHGAGPTATCFVHQLGLGEVFDAVIDFDPRVQDRYVAGTGIIVLPPQALPTRRDRYCALLGFDDPLTVMRSLRDAGHEGLFVEPLPEPRFPTRR